VCRQLRLAPTPRGTSLPPTSGSLRGRGAKGKFRFRFLPAECCERDEAVRAVAHLGACSCSGALVNSGGRCRPCSGPARKGPPPSLHLLCGTVASKRILYSQILTFNPTAVLSVQRVAPLRFGICLTVVALAVLSSRVLGRAFCAGCSLGEETSCTNCARSAILEKNRTQEGLRRWVSSRSPTPKPRQ
jgi:hypothetical protein